MGSITGAEHSPETGSAEKDQLSDQEATHIDIKVKG